MFQLLYKAGLVFDLEFKGSVIPRLLVAYCNARSEVIQDRVVEDLTEGFLWLYDEALKDYQDLPTKLVRIDIPFLPPGINSNYGFGNRKVYKTRETTDWSEKAGLIIGSTINASGWNYQEGREYGLVLIWSGTKLDVDAPVKVIMDTITRKIGFDDKHIKYVSSHKRESKEEGLIAFLGEI